MTAEPSRTPFRTWNGIDAHEFVDGIHLHAIGGEQLLLCKVTYELREAQRRSIVLTRRDAAGRLAMFLIMLARTNPRESTPNLIDMPMSRIDIADYLGLTPEAVSRATRRLKQHGVIAFDDRHRVRVLDRKRLDELASAT